MKSNVQTRDSESQTTQQADCPGCGMTRQEWSTPSGYVEEDKTYCCKGCATGDGCTCS
jgi:hypothetical protein